MRGYLGERERIRVFGRWKVVERRTLRALWECTCCDCQHGCAARMRKMRRNTYALESGLCGFIGLLVALAGLGGTT